MSELPSSKSLSQTPDVVATAAESEQNQVVTVSASTTSPDFSTLSQFAPSNSHSPDQPLPTLKVTPNKRRFLSSWWSKMLVVMCLLLILLGAIGGGVAFYTYQVVLDIQHQANTLEVTARSAYDQFKAQNLPATQQGIQQLAKELTALRQTYQKLSFYRFIPVANQYYQDGVRGLNAADGGVSAGLKSMEAIAPYADVLGFTGEGTFTGGTTEDRLKVVLQTIEKVMPVLDSISQDLQKTRTELAAINPNRYPESIKNIALRSKIIQAQEVSAGAVLALTDFRPVIEQLPAIAGADGKRKKYFILFMNDNELRPTGGFLTAYSIIYVENGKVTPEKSDDIYELDKKFKKQIAIPEKLGKYLTTEKLWNLRDMNIDPDFKNSMDQFMANYKILPGEPTDIDGVVAIDTQVLVDLMRVLGPVEVPGYGTFSAENNPKCDCPQVIYALSEIITRPTPYIRQDRKGILGPMMRALLTKAYGAPKNQWPDLFGLAWKNVQGRHAQLYFYNPQAQAAAEAVGAAGRMTLDPKGGDFFAIVDANLGGAKSNLFIKNTVEQEITGPENGTLTKKVTITYKNDHPADNCNLEAGLLCLNSTLRDWNRIYLPKGAQLTNSQGYKQGTVKQYDEAEFTVIDGEFTLEPMAQAKLVIEYTVPYTDTQKYRLKVWKQGGVESFPLLLNVNGDEKEAQTIDKDIVYESAL